MSPTTPSPFTDEEWNLVRLAPWTVAIGVAEADPGGLLHHQKELMALVHSVYDVRDHPHESWVVNKVVDDLTATDAESDHLTPVHDAGNGDIHDGVLARCRELREVLDSVVPDQAAAYTAWLMELATGVAEAATEGGFLGFGGVRVSDRERSMLTEIEQALAAST